MIFDRIIITPTSKYTVEECMSFVRSDWEVYSMSPNEVLSEVLVKHVPKQALISSEAYNDSIDRKFSYCGTEKKPYARSTVTSVAVIFDPDSAETVYTSILEYIKEYYPQMRCEDGKTEHPKYNNFRWYTRLPKYNE